MSFGLGWMEVLILAVPGVACLVVLAVVLVVAIASHRRSRSIERVAALTACVACGRVLGAEAVQLSNTRWSAAMEDIQRQNPGIRMHIVRTEHATCPGCGARYRFFEEEGVLRPHRGDQENSVSGD